MVILTDTIKIQHDQREVGSSERECRLGFLLEEMRKDGSCLHLFKLQRSATRLIFKTNIIFIYSKSVQTNPDVEPPAVPRIQVRMLPVVKARLGFGTLAASNVGGSAAVILKIFAEVVPLAQEEVATRPLVSPSRFVWGCRGCVTAPCSSGFKHPRHDPRRQQRRSTRTTICVVFPECHSSQSQHSVINDKYLMLII